MLSFEDFKRAAAENRSIADLMHETLIMLAAKDGLSKTQAAEARFRRDLFAPCCEVINSHDPKQVAAMLETITSLIAFISFIGKDPQDLISMICDDAKQKAAQAAQQHQKLSAAGISIGTKLGELGR